MKISLRVFCVALLVLSSFWLLAVIGPPVYCWFVPPKDFQSVIMALEGQEGVPASAASAVHQTVASAGSLRRAVQIGYYARAQAVIRVNERHVEKESQASYIAWFENLQRPILLILQKQQIDNGPEEFEIALGYPVSMVRGFALPFFAFVGAIFAFRWSKSKRKRP